MSDYIKREDAIKAFDGRRGFSEYDFIMWNDEVEERLNSVPAADVVEVVRCKDCRYFRKCDSYFGHDGTEHGLGICYKNESSQTSFMYLDDYCSNAVRI